jgi:D-amino peptidase
MKVYISADIEGVTGVTNFDETELHKTDSKPHVEQMTAEVVAACEGAIQAGAKEMWVKDAHDTGRNILASKLPREARLIRGWSGHPFMMLQELDASFHAAVFIGYHSRAGAGTSPLAHTLTGRIAHIKVNDRYASEFIIHTYAAAFVRVPVVFVSGDMGVCDEVAGFNPNVVTVAVKEGIGNSTVNIHPALATARICDGVKKSLQGNVARCLVSLPEHFSVEVQYKDHSKAYVYSFFPGAKQKDAFTVQFESNSYYEVMRFLLFAP